MRAPAPALALVLALALAAGTALPADGAEKSLTLNAGAYSQYVFRGLTQTDGQPALQAGGDFTPLEGLCLGTWVSNIHWFDDANPGVSVPIEWDLYAGYRHDLGAGFSAEGGVVRYAYPGRYDTLAPGTANPNMTEVYASATWRIATLKYSRALTNANGVDHSVGSWYLDLTLTAPLTDALVFTLHGGRQVFRGANALTRSLGLGNQSLYGYRDVSAALNLRFTPTWHGSLSYTRTDASDQGYVVRGRNLGSPQLTLGLVHTF